MEYQERALKICPGVYKNKRGVESGKSFALRCAAIVIAASCVVTPGDQLHGVINPPVKGTYDVFAALDLMLKGTDLKVRRLAEGLSRSLCLT